MDAIIRLPETPRIADCSFLQTSLKWSVLFNPRKVIQRLGQSMCPDLYSSSSDPELSEHRIIVVDEKRQQRRALVIDRCGEHVIQDLISQPKFSVGNAHWPLKCFW